MQSGTDSTGADGTPHGQQQQQPQNGGASGQGAASAYARMKIQREDRDRQNVGGAVQHDGGDTSER